MELAEFQRHFTQHMLASGPQNSAALGNPERVRLCRSLIRGCLWGCLEAVYPHTQVVLGARWPELCQAFIEAVPDQHWDLNVRCTLLAPFLRERWLPAQVDLPVWLGELAEYERTEMEVYLSDASDNWRISKEKRPPAPVAPTLNPTTQLLAFNYDIASWIKSEPAPGSSPDPLPTFTLIYRDPETLRCRFLNLTHAASLVLEGWSEGQDDGEVLSNLTTQGLDAESAMLTIQTVRRELALQAVIG